ncbi:hypothetical protein [Sphingomonas sp.]
MAAIDRRRSPGQIGPACRIGQHVVDDDHRLALAAMPFDEDGRTRGE